MLADCRHAIVAGVAGPDDLCVINRKRWNPDIGCMAVLAYISGLNMRRILAGCIGTVMAARAIAGDIHVIKICRQPAGRGVAVLAIVATVDMCRMFASRSYAVVTGAAGAEYLGVIDCKGWDPQIRCMAILTHVSCLHMRWRFTRCFHTVVTATAIASDVDVVEVGRQPGDSGMAIVAVVAAGDVCRVFASRRDAIVT